MPCLDCGRPGARLCTSCSRTRDRARGTTTQRGYGHEHQVTRADLAPEVDAGAVRCWRCGRLIAPGEPWHLGHDDEDRSITRGPEHEECNLSAAGKAAHRHS